MIKFALICKNGHEFESWFSNNAAFDTQSEHGLVACPMCASTNVEKALMAPNLTTRSNSKEAPDQITQAIPPPAPTPTNQPVKNEAVALAAQVISNIKNTADNVGDKFVDEARKIHYDEAPARAIWGNATLGETKDLIEEGIGIIPLPPDPKDQN